MRSCESILMVFSWTAGSGGVAAGAAARHEWKHEPLQHDAAGRPHRRPARQLRRLPPHGGRPRPRLAPRQVCLACQEPVSIELTTVVALHIVVAAACSDAACSSPSQLEVTFGILFLSLPALPMDFPGILSAAVPPQTSSSEPLPPHVSAGMAAQRQGSLHVSSVVVLCCSTSPTLECDDCKG